MSGKEPGRIPVVDADPMKTSALPTADSYEFFSAWEKKSNWKNDVTVRRWVDVVLLCRTDVLTNLFLVLNCYGAMNRLITSITSHQLHF